MSYIDKFLNSITMYRLVLYGLIILIALSIAFAFTNVLPLNGLHMLSSLVVITAAAAISNNLLGRVFKIPTNVESIYITAFILFLIMPPAGTLKGQVILALTAVLAMASKYVLNIKGKHLFNPAAIGALLVGFGGLVFPTWWVGSAVLLPVIIVLGLLMVRKVRRFDLFVSFLVVAVTAIVITNLNYGVSFVDSLKSVFTSWPIIFFGTVMLTEPLTSPPTKNLRIFYGVIVGLLLGTSFTLGPLHSSPELALILGNIFSYIVSPKERLILKLKEKLQLAPAVYDFVFSSNKPMAFTAGQFMEWTLGHDNSDTRGNRRYFTIASSPTENEIHLGVKVPPEPSSFKKALIAMKPGDELFAGALSGEFNLPKDPTTKVVAIAGGVGITPFRSMAKNLMDTKQKRDMVLFYLSADQSEFVYKDVFDAAKTAGVKTVYMLTVEGVAPANWKGRTGRITEQVIKDEVPDFQNRHYFISGPPGMVEAYKKLLTSIGVPRMAIKTDYFPGY